MAIKFRILKENFQKALEAVGPAATGRTTINALYGVLITTKDDTITLSATDLELRIDAQAPALILQKGQALVKYQTLNSQIRSLPSEPVDVEIIEANEDNDSNATSYAQILSVSCGHASARLYCENTDMFPPLPENDENTKVEIPTDALGRAIRMVSSCVATEDSRPTLTTVSLTVNPVDGTLTTAGADGFRLAQMEVPCEIKGDEEVAICIPRNSAREIERALARNPGKACLSLDSAASNAQFSLSEGVVVLTTQLLRENPPNYQNVIPVGPMQRNIVLTSAALKSGINSVAGISQLGDNVTRIYPKDPSQEFPQGALIFTASAEGQFSRNVVNIESSLPEDAPLNYTAINHKYLTDFMTAVGNDSPIEISIDNFEHSVRLSNADESYVYIVMPMGVRWPNPNAPKDSDDQPPGDTGNQGIIDIRRTRRIRRIRRIRRKTSKTSKTSKTNPTRKTKTTWKTRTTTSSPGDSRKFDKSKITPDQGDLQQNVLTDHIQNQKRADLPDPPV